MQDVALTGLTVGTGVARGARAGPCAWVTEGPVLALAPGGAVVAEEAGRAPFKEIGWFAFMDCTNPEDGIQGVRWGPPQRRLEWHNPSQGAQRESAPFLGSLPPRWKRGIVGFLELGFAPV